MKKVFVAGALLPTGGAYMAYHLGRILHRHFGYELFDIGISPVETRLFNYDTPIATVSIAQMESMIDAGDLMVVNPSLSSFLFGLRLPGRKIMYAQGFTTFLTLDCHFDLYVSVSSVVARYLDSLYDIPTKVIPAFIQLGGMPPAKPWHERTAGSALVYMKHPSREHRVVLEELRAKLPHIDLSHVIEGRGMEHGEFMRRLGEVRYFVNLSLAEGFGLVPLEAMAMGTMVTGVDGMGGCDYMRSGENCLVGSLKNLRTLPALVAQAFADEALAERCAAAGQNTAMGYGYEPFKTAWIKQFAEFLQVAPQNA